MTIQPISTKLEKWILIVLLAFAMAAFLGFKLFENSDLSFTLTDPAERSSHSKLSNDDEFKNEFKKNRNEARAMMQEHASAKKTTPKYGKGATKYYAKKKSNVKKFAKKSSSKKKIAHKSIRSNKKSLAIR